jgi:ERCC4-type nuclease
MKRVVPTKFDIYDFIFVDSRHVTLTEGRLLKPNDNELTVIDLRLGDAMVLQCNASNTYGYVFAEENLSFNNNYIF